MDLLTLSLTVSTVLAGLIAGLFFAYSVSVVLALDTLVASTYTTVMQSINELILNPVFGLAFAGVVVVPAVGVVVLVFQGEWTAAYGQLFVVGFLVYVVGTLAVTMLIHIPMNEYIATWTADSPPGDWMAIRARWTRWNHVRTTAAVASFVLYTVALVLYAGRQI